MKLGDKNTIVIVGAGLSGAVLAERYASSGKKVIILEKRHHIAGNCYDYIDENGILRSLYGAHIFHTSYDDVWEYVNQFTKWIHYTHKVRSIVDGKLVPVPANVETYNRILGLQHTPETLKDYLENKNAYRDIEVKNSEDSALKRLGSRELYDKMFKVYTKKQWDMYPAELEASVMERIPVRFDYNERYFNDPHEGLPENGYTEFVKNMLDNELIEIHLNVDYSDVDVEYEKLFFTGPIDEYFNNKFGKLQYRSIRFEDELIETDQYQSLPVINYPQGDVEFTRIVEHKNFYGKGDKNVTVITKEYSSWDGPSYYPVPNQANRDLYSKYQKEAEKLEKDGVYFVGRLANYKYFNMDQAIKNALDIFKEIEDEEVV